MRSMAVRTVTMAVKQAAEVRFWDLEAQKYEARVGSIHFVV